MKEGTQNMMSLSVAFAAWNRFSGVGMVGGDFGSKVLNTKPHAALERDQKILLQLVNRCSPTKMSVEYPFLSN
jgi:hypothetical protein